MRGTRTCRAASTDFSPAADILKPTPIQPLALPCRVGDSFYWFTNITNEKSKRGPPSGGSQLKTTIMGSR
ncbi:MAG: hypothetical protein ACK554_04590, partial [Erythrobacteraceae bacterium]